MTNQGALILGALSCLFALFSVRDYLRGGRKLSASAKVWQRIAIIFAVIAVSLTVM
jgi:hypothetical protein